MDAGQLIVFTESAAWATRLRYAVAEAGDALREAHPTIDAIVVKVSPRRAD